MKGGEGKEGKQRNSGKAPFMGRNKVYSGREFFLKGKFKRRL